MSRLNSSSCILLVVSGFQFLIFFLWALAVDENGSGSGIDLENVFFEIEHEIENDVCRDEICLNHEKEKGKY